MSSDGCKPQSDNRRIDAEGREAGNWKLQCSCLRGGDWEDVGE